MAFSFRLSSVQKFREHQRDLVRQRLAEVLQQDQQLQERAQRLQQERAGVLAEILGLATRARLDVDGVSARRYHIGQIDVACLHIAHERQQLAVVIDQIRAELVLADQNVKSLDQLQTRQQGEYQAVQLQREQREREDLWQAGQLGRRAPSGDQP